MKPVAPRTHIRISCDDIGPRLLAFNESNELVLMVYVDSDGRHFMGWTYSIDLYGTTSREISPEELAGIMGWRLPAAAEKAA